MAESTIIDEIWMFGSAARQESNDTSDVDLLVVSDEVVLPDHVNIELKERYGDHVDLAHYSYFGLGKLAKQGALFAWHLRDEAVPLHRRMDRLEGILANVSPYVSHKRDLEVLLSAFDEAVASLHVAESVKFDLGIVGTVIRNTGIIMHDLLGSRDYSPAAPVRLLDVPGAPRLPIQPREYELLNDCRRASERGAVFENSELSLLNKMAASFESIRAWLVDCINCTRGT